MNRMWVRNRQCVLFATASYMLALSTAALFHHHAQHGRGCCLQHQTALDRAPVAASEHCDHHDGGPSPSEDDHDSAPRPADEHDCPICQFISQGLAIVYDPATVVTPLRLEAAPIFENGRLVHDFPSPWHSRGPPLST